MYEFNIDELEKIISDIFRVINDSQTNLQINKKSFKTMVSSSKPIYSKNTFYENEINLSEDIINKVDSCETNEQLKEIFVIYSTSKYANYLAYFKHLISREKNMGSIQNIPMIIATKLKLMYCQSITDVEEIVSKLIKGLETLTQDNKNREFLTFYHIMTFLTEKENENNKSDREGIYKVLVHNLNAYIATKEEISWKELTKILKILDLASDLLIISDIDEANDLLGHLSFINIDQELIVIEQQLIRARM